MGPSHILPSGCAGKVGPHHEGQLEAVAPCPRPQFCLCPLLTEATLHQCHQRELQDWESNAPGQEALLFWMSSFKIFWSLVCIMQNNDPMPRQPKQYFVMEKSTHFNCYSEQHMCCCQHSLKSAFKWTRYGADLLDISAESASCSLGGVQYCGGSHVFAATTGGDSSSWGCSGSSGLSQLSGWNGSTWDRIWPYKLDTVCQLYFWEKREDKDWFCTAHKRETKREKERERQQESESM